MPSISSSRFIHRASLQPLDRPFDYFRKNPLALLISGACLQATCLSALAAPCPTASGGIISVTGSVDSACSVGNGEQLSVASTGVISLANQFGSAALVAPGVTATSINNQGSILSPYNGGNSNGDALAIQNGGSVSGGITNSGTITGDSNSISLSTGRVDGGLTNLAAGRIGGSNTYVAMELNGQSMLSGGIDNAGHIGSSRGIHVDHSTVTGGIHNRSTGLIDDTGFGGFAVLVESGAIAGDIANEGAIDGGEGALIFRSSSTYTGNIVNSGGSITSSETAIGFDDSTMTGNIANSGIISGFSQGAIFLSASTMTGNITNSGTIQGHLGGGIHLANHSTLSGGIDNQAGGVIDGGESSVGLQLEQGSTITGSILNAGTITSQIGVGSASVRIDNSTVGGAIDNSGLITNTSNGEALLVRNGSSIGALVNSGTISGHNIDTNDNNNGVDIDGSTVANGITNSGTITGQQGLVLQNGATIAAGGINNTGQIVGDSVGLSIYNVAIIGGIVNAANASMVGGSIGVYLDAVTMTGNIDNAGLIDGHVGMWVQGSTIQGDIVNHAGASITDSISGYALLVSNSTVSNVTSTGLIRGTNGIGVQAATISGTLLNNPGGTITAQDGSGIEVRGFDAAPATVGQIANGGSITGKHGIVVDSAAVAGGIANLSGGVIDATEVGVLLTAAASVGGIVNAGILRGTAGGIDVDATSTLSGGITNTGLISSGAGFGIRVLGSNFSGTIDNRGTIAGATAAIDLSGYTGAAKSIAIDNRGALNGAVLIGTQTLNLNGNASSVNGAVQGTGDVNVNGAFAQQGSFDVGTFTINSGGTFLAADTVSASSGVKNFGTLSVKVAQPFAIAGDYAQSADGIFLMQASTPTRYSKMTVSGHAVLAPLTHIQVDVTPGATLIPNGVLPGVIVAGSLDASTFTVTDNSVLFNFIGVVNGNAVDLNVKPGLTVYDSTVAHDNSPGGEAAKALDSIIQSGTATGDMNTVIAALGTLTTTQQVSDAVRQTLPVMTGGTNTAVMGTLDAVGKIVQARQEANLGLSSGDDFLVDRAFWMKPFGSWSRQGNRGGVEGYHTNGGGVVAGIDGGLTETARLGFALAYAHTAIDSDSDVAPQAADIDTYQAVVYGSQTLAEHTDLNYQIDFGANQNDAHRYIDFGGLNRRATSDSSGWSGHAGLGLGRQFWFGAGTVLTPSVRVDYAALKNRSYREEGAGALDLDVNAQTTDQLLIGVDAKLNQEIEQGLTFTANVGAAYDTLNRTNAITSTYAGGGPAFATRGLDPSPWILRGGFGLVSKETSGFEVSARYDVESRSTEFLNQTVSVKFRMPF